MIPLNKIMNAMEGNHHQERDFFKVISPLPKSDIETACWCHYGTGSKYNEGNTQDKIRTYNRRCDEIY